jgi:quercetin dioxygenase-like cupin family protein
MGGGRVIANPVSGERIVIRESGATTGGKMLGFDLFLPPGGHVPAWHVHPAQEERFTVVTGRMRFRMGGRRILAGPGDTVVVPAARAHWFGNAGDDVAHAWVEVRPALRMEQFLEANEAIGQAGRFFGTGLPRLTDLALVLLEFRREVGIPWLPAFLVNALLAPFAWLARHRRRVHPV